MRAEIRSFAVDISELVYLYVEDEPLSREVMEMILSMGVQTSTYTIFENSKDFSERIDALNPQPDIVLLDIHMDPLDGFEMLNILRAHADYREVPVVALTASVMNEEVEKLREAGFDAAISKPVSITTFPALIQQIANRESVWHIG